MDNLATFLTSTLYSALVFAGMTFTAYRLTRLAVTDTYPPIAKFRAWISSKADFLDELFHCSYCASFWVSAAVILVSGLFLPLTWPAYQFFALWSLAGIMADFY